MAIPSGGNVNPQDSANKRITDMSEKRSDRGYRPAVDGIERKTLAHGVRTLMRRFLTGGCLLYALWCAKAIGQDQNASFRIEGLAAPRDVEFTARADGSRQRYVEFLPLGYTSNQPCSLMIFLHGHGADFFQILWYPNGGLLNEGVRLFLASTNAGRMHFTIEFVNHPPFELATDRDWKRPAKDGARPCGTPAT